MDFKRVTQACLRFKTDWVFNLEDLANGQQKINLILEANTYRKVTKTATKEILLTNCYVRLGFKIRIMIYPE